jgi:hypothetical protein
MILRGLGLSVPLSVCSGGFGSFLVDWRCGLVVCRREFTGMRGMSSITTFCYFGFPGKLCLLRTYGQLVGDHWGLDVEVFKNFRIFVSW